MGFRHRFGVPSFNWTDAAVATLVRMKAEGKSCRQIAEAIGGGVTRNAVIGKAARLMSPAVTQETSARDKIAAGLREATAVARGDAKSARRRVTARPRSVPPTASDGRVTIHNLTESCCGWPIGDPREEAFRYCGGPKTTPGPYCDQHRALAYATPHGRTVSFKTSKSALTGLHT